MLENDQAKLLLNLSFKQRKPRPVHQTRTSRLHQQHKRTMDLLRNQRRRLRILPIRRKSIQPLHRGKERSHPKRRGATTLAQSHIQNLRKNIPLPLQTIPQTNQKTKRTTSKKRVRIRRRKPTTQRRIQKNTLPSRPNNPTKRIPNGRNIQRQSRKTRTRVHNLYTQIHT